MFDGKRRADYASIGLLGVTFVATVVLTAAARPLWYDEILTFYIARLESPTAIVRALLAGAEIHPPVDYVLRHLSMRLFGETELAFRAPSIAAALAASLSLFLFVRRRMSLSAAVVAFVFPFTGFALRHAHEGRPYSLLLATMCMSLLAWQFATQRQSAPRLAFLAAALGLGPYVHYYGVLNYAPIVLGEAWRSWEHRRICWPVVASIAASLAPLPLLYPLIANATDYAPNFWTRFGPATPLAFYVTFFAKAAVPLIAAVVGILMLDAFRPLSAQAPTRSSPVLRHELIAVAVLCLVPFMAYAIAEAYTNALSTRYTIVTIAGGALLAAYATEQAGKRRRAYGAVIAASFAAFGAGSATLLALKAPYGQPQLANATIRFVETARLPVALGDPHLFLPLQLYLPEPLRRRTYYLSDRDYAAKNTRHDTDERVLEDIRPYATLNLVDYCAFVTRHREFLVLGQRQWLVPRLLKAGATVTLENAPGLSARAFHVRMLSRTDCASRDSEGRQTKG